MTPITREQAHAFLARWKLVKQTQMQDLRETPIETKMRQLSTLMASRDLFRPDLDRELHSLERKGFVRRQKRSSVEGESEFAFAHALVRDVAYGQIARADRA